LARIRRNGAAIYPFMPSGHCTRLDRREECGRTSEPLPLRGTWFSAPWPTFDRYHLLNDFRYKVNNHIRIVVRPASRQMFSSSIRQPHWMPASVRGAETAVLLLHQRAVALLVERPPGFLRGNGRELLVIVPRRLALLGRLHLEQIHRVNLAAVDA